MAHIVITALVVASAPDGSQVYLYEGAPVPQGIDEAEIARLVAGGFISEGTPDGEPSDEWTVKQLEKHADDNGVDLGGATKKADILAAITAAKA